MTMYGVQLAALLAVVVGCADSHQLIRASSSTALIAKQASAYVAVPADGRYGNTVYFGSGALTAQAVGAAFAPHLAKITVAVTSEDVEAARQAAKALGHTYLLYPEILHWEDRATVWSGRPDVASVKLSVIRVDGGDIIDSAVVGGKSGLATVGGDRPEHLLPKPLADYAATLFPK
jgi:Domain of unknown function (DUF4823)